MTKTLLLEIGLEELPAQYVSSSAAQLLTRVENYLKEANLSFEAAKSFSTPRRLAVMVKGIAEKQADVEEEVKGPAKKIALDDAGNWSKAAEGFVRGQGLTTADITFKEIKGIEYVHVQKFTPGKLVIEVLAGLDKVITAMTFPVSMHWGNHSFKYIRPVKWVTALLNDEIIPFMVMGVTTDRTSRGHRFLGDPVSFAQAEDYEAALEKQFVIADASRRKLMITEQIEEMAQKNAWVVDLDADLLEEVNNLVEYPTVFSGQFNESFLDIPEEVLITSMKEHQRYFYVKNKAGQLLPYFISARNGDAVHIENVAKGNEKVLAARLEDGAFFYQEDQQITIAAAVERLKNITFHEKIGSVYEKMLRVKELAQIIGQHAGLTKEELAQLNRAAEIYKFDLVTNMVGEFPELQGIMGEKYALLQGEEPAVAQAIREHYMPTSSEGALPASNIGTVLAIADKYDSVASFFAVGMIPTGSNDPYALRRQAYGVVRMIEEKGWSFPIEQIETEMIASLTKNDHHLLAHFIQQKDEVITFVKGRIRQLLQGRKIRHDVIDAVLNSSQEDMPVLVQTARILESNLNSATFKPTIESLTRVMNLARKGAKDAIEKTDFVVDEALFENESEKALYQEICRVEKVFEVGSISEEFTALESLQPTIDQFFDETMVMTEDKAVRENRLALLGKLGKLVISFASLDGLIVK
ncbi:glycine--tRNA ligase subunit beta [Isobaculum melis]|uniref:Glycine--tRNA ligase beta subunit n=1 Tax=Isobaculum melis TaxID=142588 RepID=A0A1H9R2T9_9LACT|nr:glycine--tRNA ligase subunit beta [Isobaculum melis]SER67151.1 glycyl-tRNA synthetase beta chain [Isobaculum melis]